MTEPAPGASVAPGATPSGGEPARPALTAQPRTPGPPGATDAVYPPPNAPDDGRDPFAPDFPVVGEVGIHLDHGIARLVGIEAVAGPPGTCDFLMLTFGEDAAPMLPVAELTRVWRHVPWASGLSLDRLGTKDWTRHRDAAMHAVSRGLRRDRAPPGTAPRRAPPPRVTGRRGDGPDRGPVRP